MRRNIPAPGTRVWWLQAARDSLESGLIREGQVYPLTGIVLDPEDPEVWAGSIAFPTKSPDPAAVKAYFAAAQARGSFTDTLPVRWDTVSFRSHQSWAPIKELLDYDPGPRSVEELKEERPKPRATGTVKKRKAPAAASPPAPKRPAKQGPQLDLGNGLVWEEIPEDDD